MIVGQVLFVCENKSLSRYRVHWLQRRSCNSRWIFSYRMILPFELRARKKREEEEGNEEEGEGAVVVAAQQHGVEKGKPRWSSTTGRPRRCTLADLSATEKEGRKRERERKDEEEDTDSERARRARRKEKQRVKGLRRRSRERKQRRRRKESINSLLFPQNAPFRKTRITEILIDFANSVNSRS